MASLAPSLTSISLSDSTLIKPSLFQFRSTSASASLRPSIYNIPNLSISFQRKSLQLTPLFASGWTQQEVEDKQVDGPEGDSDFAGEDEGDFSWSEEEVEGGEEGVSEETEENLGDAIVGEETGDVEGEDYPEPPEEAKLFVGGIPFDITTEKLAELFDQAGVVDVAEIIYNRETDQSRGFGFVTMRTVEEAEKAIKMFDRYELNGRILKVNKATPRGTRVERQSTFMQPQHSVYVGNLSWSTDEVRLEQVFSEFGKDMDGRALRVNIAEQRSR
ncbi:ribonucleoprotein [Carex littledalei]|uniref:Ribonucleoprotein n=1 Tax=Carex littledalei TaxID=544730 RepID=A0A833VX67_9POAL|nr:ribonucleoprotein [Carex littledalei]